MAIEQLRLAERGKGAWSKGWRCRGSAKALGPEGFWMITQRVFPLDLVSGHA